MASILTIIQQQDEEYDRLYALYHEAKQRVEFATTPEELEAATTAFHPIQQEFLRNRERATPTECYQIIASYLDRESRARLAQCDKHLHYQVIYGKYSGRFVWSVGGLLEQRYRGSYRMNRLTTTPLAHATGLGTVRVVRVLIDGKANLEVGDERFGCAPLHWASVAGHEEVVRLLIDAGADVNVMDNDNESPLDCDAQSNHFSIVSRLLTAGAKPNNGMRYAVENDNCAMVNVLLEAKADVNFAIANRAGSTVLHSSAIENSANVIPILIAAGANINQRDDFGGTPLTLACIHNKTDAAIALLAANADPNIVENIGESPLMYASLNGNVDIVRALLAANANVHAVNNYCDTALKRAKAAKHDEEVISLLRAAGAIDDEDANE